MQIFGLDPFVAAVGITILGVVISVGLGWLKGTKEFNVRQGAASAIIALFVSAPVVISTVGQISPEADSLAVGAIVFGLIASVAGIDSISKSAAQAVSKARKAK